MKKIKILGFLLILMIGGYTAKAQYYTPKVLQLYVSGSTSFNSLYNLPNNTPQLGLDFNIGVTKYFYQNIFFDASLGLSNINSQFDGEIITPVFNHLGHNLCISTLRLMMPLSIGQSFIFAETQQQIDFMGGIYLSYNLSSEIRGDRSVAPRGNPEHKPLLILRGSQNGKDGRSLLYPSNIGLQLGTRYWILPSLFIKVSASLDLINILNSNDIRVGSNDNAIGNYSSRNMNLSVGAGYSF